MKLLHLNTLTMNLHPDGLRWQRFTGIMLGSRMLGVFRDCDIDHQNALAEYERTWSPKRVPKRPYTGDEIYEFELTGAVW